MRPLLPSAVLLITLATPSLGAAQSLEGVWRLVEFDLNAGSGPVDEPAYTAYFDGYYTIMWVTTDFPNGNGQPRPGFGQDASLEEVFAAWGPFAAQFGTYELSGSEITYTQLVSKGPGGMLPENATFSRNFRVEGNTLETRGGDPTAVYRYERVR